MHAGHRAKQRPRRQEGAEDRTGPGGARASQQPALESRIGARKDGVGRGGPSGPNPPPGEKGRLRAARPPGPGARRRRGGAAGRPGAAPASAVAVETVVAAGRRLGSPLLRGASLLAALQLLLLPIQRVLQGREHRGGSERPCVPAKPLPRRRTVLGGRARPAPGPRAPEFRWWRWALRASRRLPM